MIRNKGTVLVIGGTGHQGAAAIGHLLARDMSVRALLPHASPAEADALQLRGVMPVHANPDDQTSLERVFRDVDAVLVVIEDTEAGPDDRLRRGMAIGDAAARAGVRHIVYAAGTAPDHHLNACDRSEAIEHYFRALDLPAVVLRPATIMEEIPWYWLGRFGSHVELTAPYEADARLSMIAADDVAGIAALAVAEPWRFRGRTIDLAGEVVTLGGVADLLATGLGESVRFSQVQTEGVFMYAEAVARSTDISWLRGVYPPLHSLSAWLEEGGGLDLCRRRVARTAPAGMAA